MNKDKLSYSEFKFKLQAFWEQRGFDFASSFDCKMGAATMHPSTINYLLAEKPCRGLVFFQPCRRPLDNFPGSSNKRMQAYEQLQIISFERILYNEVLLSLAINEDEHIVQFLQDDWKSPTLGAYGIGHELRVDGVEIVQLTRFYTFGGKKLEKECYEITYGCERCYFIKTGIMHSSHMEPFMVFNEEEKLEINFIREKLDKFLTKSILSYEEFLEASHLFNLLDAKGVVGKIEKNQLMLALRDKFVILINNKR